MRTFALALRAESTKLLSLQSLQIALLAACIIPPALAWATGVTFDPARAQGLSLDSRGFETSGFGQPLVILMAALSIGAEFSDGQLRTTLLANPSRGIVLSAKLLTLTVATAVVAAISALLSVMLERHALREHGSSLALFPDDTLLRLGGITLNYVLIALIAAALTVLARTPLLALIVLVPLVLGITISLVGFLPLLRYLPDLAGIQLLMPYPGIGLLDPLPGALVMAAWAICLLTAAAIAFRTRDVAG